MQWRAPSTTGRTSYTHVHEPTSASASAKDFEEICRRPAVERDPFAGEPPRPEAWAVLLVDDDPQVLRSVERLLRGRHRVLACESGKEALVALTEHDVGVIVTDQIMPEMSGFDLLREVRRRYPDSLMTRVVLSACADFALLEGFVNECRIDHFLSKPFAPDELREVVAKATDSYEGARAAAAEKLRLEAAQKRLAEENRSLRNRLGQAKGFERIVGDSSALRHALQRIELVRKSEVSVHLSGETGTGKELAARAIHEGGGRADRPFIIQNCGGLNDQLLHSTLFGHKKGAFTGADRDHRGVFEQADGGTLFLDEVAELSPAAQASLLRVLEVGEVVPVGATAPIHVDVRIISATHANLRSAVEEGSFREDLYYRLVIVSIELPPLREREGDVPLLLAHFLRVHSQAQNKPVSGFSAGSLATLEHYPWPGNIRELSHEVQRLVVLAQPNEVIPSAALSERVRTHTIEPKRAPVDLEDGILIPSGLSYDEARLTLARRLITQALEESDGVVRKAAEVLGMERSRLAKLRRRLGVMTEFS